MVANFDDDNKKNDGDQKKAVALKYETEKGDTAPKVVAKGRGWLAQQIAEIAREHDIPIHEDADLVQILDKVEVDQEIPLEVYAVVAEIFAYIYRYNKKKKEA